MRGYLFVMVVAAAVTYLTTPAARRLARRIGAITPVRDRDVHAVPIPRLGGTAIFAGFAAALIIAREVPFFHDVFAGHGPLVVLACAGGVCLLGVADDLWGLDAITKLAGQALAAGVMAWQGVQLISLPFGFGQLITSSYILVAATVVFVVMIINAVNFVDGLDGLAAGIVGIAGSAFFVYSYLLSRSLGSGDQASSDYASLASLITAAMVGACVGFLPHNFNPARIFMGDSGSMLLGLLLATATVAITANIDPGAESQIVPAFLPMVLPVAVVALPVMDLLLAVVRRTRAGRNPFAPDKQHLHHRMLQLGHSHARAVLILYTWTATVAFGVVSVAFLSQRTALLLGLGAVVLAALLTLGPLRGRAARAAQAANPREPAGAAK